MIYESVFVFSGQLSSKSAEDNFQKYQNLIKDSGGEILKKESWGLRDLAYTINKNSKAYYFMINCKCTSSIFNDFNVKLKQDDGFLRLLNLRIKSVSKNPSILIESKDK
jgi:small subunit ribosomal protein S6